MIPEDYDGIVPRGFEPFAEAFYLISLTVNVTGVINHRCATFPSISISANSVIVLIFRKMYSQTPENVFASELFEGISFFDRWFM